MRSAWHHWLGICGEYGPHVQRHLVERVIALRDWLMPDDLFDVEMEDEDE